jgi:hypothetical protein
MRLFVGDDWAEDHHDVKVMDEAGRVLAKKRLPEGVAGMTQLHELIGRHVPGDAEDAEVVIGIGTDRGPWVAALVAAGYVVFPVNPLQASRYRERHGVSGAKSDQGDSDMLADMVRTDSRQLRPAAGDSPEAEGVKVVARTHKTLIWDRTRAVPRLRHQLREYFPILTARPAASQCRDGRAERAARRREPSARRPPQRVRASRIETQVRTSRRVLEPHRLPQSAKFCLDAWSRNLMASRVTSLASRGNCSCATAR